MIGGSRYPSSSQRAVMLGLTRPCVAQSLLAAAPQVLTEAPPMVDATFLVMQPVFDRSWLPVRYAASAAAAATTASPQKIAIRRLSRPESGVRARSHWPSIGIP